MRLHPALLVLLALAAGCALNPTTRATERGGAADAGGVAERLTPPDRDRPNVLFIVVDDLRPALGAYGDRAAVTPNLDRLAASSVVFERAYANVPVCGASRASLLTGLRPTQERFLTYFTRADADAPQAPTLPGFFKGRGYHTASVGKVFHNPEDSQDSWSEPLWHPWYQPGASPTWRNYLRPENNAIEAATSNPMGRGAGGPPYERVAVPDSAYYDGQIALEAARTLRRLAGGADPFFLAVGFLKPHLPFNAPARYWGLHPYGEVELPQSGALPLGAPAEAWRVHGWGELRSYAGVPAEGPVPDSLARRLVQGYRAATSYVDAQVGLVLDKLDRLGLAENTVVVLFGDHGFSLGEHGLWSKHSTFDVALRAPLIVRAPGVRAGRAAGLVEFVDLFPSLVDLAGLPAPAGLQGESFVPLLRDPGGAGKDAVFARYQEAEAVKTDGHLYTEWLAEGAAGDSVEARMLYDHRADPRETVNLAPRAGGVVDRLSRMLRSLR